MSTEMLLLLLLLFSEFLLISESDLSVYSLVAISQTTFHCLSEAILTICLFVKEGNRISVKILMSVLLCVIVQPKWASIIKKHDSYK